MPEKCERCNGTGKVGIAESTEGSVDIICLECLGTGFKKEVKKYAKSDRT